jgi:hypothetical protein
MSIAPLPHRDAIGHLRSIRRTMRKLRERLRKKGEVSNKDRHELYGMTEHILSRIDDAIKVLDAVREERRKSAKRRKPLQYFGLGGKDGN